MSASYFCPPSRKTGKGMQQYDVACPSGKEARPKEENTKKHAPDRSRAIYGGSVETSGPYLRDYTTGKSYV